MSWPWVFSPPRKHSPTCLQLQFDPPVTVVSHSLKRLQACKVRDKTVRTRQSEMANTSPATCQCLATFIPLKWKILIFFRDVISLLARVVILLIDTATQEVPIKIFDMPLNCYMLNVAHVTNDVKWRLIVTKFDTLIENIRRTGLYECHNF